MILVINVRDPEKLYAAVAKGLKDGSVIAIHNVAETDVPWLRPDVKR